MTFFSRGGSCSDSMLIFGSVFWGKRGMHELKRSKIGKAHVSDNSRAPLSKMTLLMDDGVPNL